jgi:hypothetical protein
MHDDVEMRKKMFSLVSSSLRSADDEGREKKEIWKQTSCSIPIRTLVAFYNFFK